MTRIARLGALAIACLAMAPRTADAAVPSFDCDGARSQVEKLICGDDALAALDARLARRLARALARADADKVAGLSAAQRAWRARMLKACAQADDPRACVADAYDKRIGEL